MADNTNNSGATGAKSPVIKLNIVKPGGTTPVLKPVTVPVPPVTVGSDVDSEDYDDSSSSSEEGDGYYVEVTLTCENDDGDSAEHNVVLNFGSETRYMDHAESGFDELDEIFTDAVSLHFPLWTYSNEWEEVTVHGAEFDDDEAIVVDIP